MRGQDADCCPLVSPSQVTPRQVTPDQAAYNALTGTRGGFRGESHEATCFSLVLFPHLPWFTCMVGEQFLGIEGIGMRKIGNPQTLKQLAVETVRPETEATSMRGRKIDQIAQDIRETGI